MDRQTSLGSLLAAYLRAGFGSTDGIALACAHRASEEDHLPLALLADERLTAVKLPREARETSWRVGRQLFNTLSRLLRGSEYDVGDEKSYRGEQSD